MTAQLRPKADAGSVVARLLAAEDLPGGRWRVTGQRTWRTGVIGPPTPHGERARQAGSVTAWRSFRNRDAGRWAWIQIAQFASPDDAEGALDGIWDRGLANLRAKVQLVSERDITMAPFDGASAVRAREQHTAGATGDGVALMLAAAVGDWLMILGLSGSPAWDWPAATALAARQFSRLGTA